jgi:hypothetical protein
MANNFKDFVVAAMQEAGMNDDQVIAALDKIAGNDKIGSKLNGILKTATEDYNAQVGRVNTLTQRNEYLEKDWYPKADASYKQLQTEYQKVLGELQQAQATGVAPNFDPTAYMTKADYEKGLQILAQRWGSTLIDAVTIASDHTATFKEKLDMKAIDDLAVRMAQERGLTPGAVPIRDVYEKYIEPRKKAAEEEGRKNWEKETRAQIERDLRSQNNLPTNPVPVEQSQMFSPTPTDKIPKDMDMELLNTWNNAGNGTH